jgi:nitrite reductase/ring-hydroxylating ferredoxin subunit
MFANLSALAMFAIARAGRREEDEPAAPWALAAEVAGVGLLTTGGWLGGTLVYRNQIGVDHRYANAGRWRVEASAEPSETIDAAAIDELDVDQMKLVRAGRRRIVLARTEQGHVAFDDRCTHKGGPLADGTLACGVVQCPWHGSQFDVRSGRVRQGPAKQSIKTYPVEEREGRIWISLKYEV